MDRAKLGALVRSFLAGGAATLADVFVLSVGVGLFGLSPRVASLPALVAGGIVNFYGNRNFAFRASSGSMRRQAVLYVVTEAIALLLNGLLFDVAVRWLHPTTFGLLLLRLATQNAVFLVWSFPIWRRVFRPVPANVEHSTSAHIAPVS